MGRCVTGCPPGRGCRMGAERREVVFNDLEQPIFLDAVVVVAQAVPKTAYSLPRLPRHQFFGLVPEPDHCLCNALQTALDRILGSAASRGCADRHNSYGGFYSRRFRRRLC